MAIFAAVPLSLLSRGYDTILLSFSPLLNEEKLGSREHFDLIGYVLSLYNKSLENVVALIEDNAETNKCLATQIDKPFIGCASHRLSLGIKDYLARYDTILAKINGPMGKLKSVKFSAKLRKYTDLRPVQQNETRWSSIAEMVERYLSIKDYLVHFDEQILVEFLLTPREMYLKLLNTRIKMFESVTKALQDEEIDIGSIRALFNDLLKQIPELDEYHNHLHSDSSVVNCVDFENAIVKFQDSNEDKMTGSEKLTVQDLEIETVEVSSKENVVPDDFAFPILKKRAKMDCKSKYVNTKFLLGTSNIVERFFSTAGLSYTDYRQLLTPAHLEEQLF